jgi:hypothetical protein
MQMKSPWKVAKQIIWHIADNKIWLLPILAQNICKRLCPYWTSWSRGIEHPQPSTLPHFLISKVQSWSQSLHEAKKNRASKPIRIRNANTLCGVAVSVIMMWSRRCRLTFLSWMLLERSWCWTVIDVSDGGTDRCIRITYPLMTPWWVWSSDVKS